MSKRSGGFAPRSQMNPKDLMRQVQQMQAQMESIQEEAHKEVLEVSSGGGMVTLTINGALQVVEMLQDLVLTAINEAIKKAQAMVTDRMSALTGGLGIPGF